MAADYAGIRAGNRTEKMSESMSKVCGASKVAPRVRECMAGLTLAPRNRASSSSCLRGSSAAGKCSILTPAPATPAHIMRTQSTQAASNFTLVAARTFAAHLLQLSWRLIGMRLGRPAVSAAGPARRRGGPRAGAHDAGVPTGGRAPTVNKRRSTCPPPATTSRIRLTQIATRRRDGSAL